MLSKNLNNLIAQMRTEITSESKLVALDFATEQLVQRAPHVACLRCNKATFFVDFEKPNQGSKFKEWIFGLGSCGAGIALEQEESGPGLIALDAAFCSGQNSNLGKHNQNVGKPIKAYSTAGALAQSERPNPRSMQA